MNLPYNLFDDWFNEASKVIEEPNSMSIATVNKEGKPSLRIVLLKEFNEHGFVFYTNLESKKSLDIKENPYVAICFFWKIIGKQVRIEGNVIPVSNEEADEYFATRPRLSQVGAWASKQSRFLSSREELLQMVNEIEKKYEGKTIPRPPHWSGWRVIPSKIEFWKEGEGRLHTRRIFDLENNIWNEKLLFP
ncbi:MAG: pyridoxamine 5'-phosphate oxidase [Chlorobiota bacterium]|jgi:pyridoxamine 5'-phosphate oxidase|nr:MAG: pyridoxamine 5'-phosphate oxidase [Chlorobiota bacterium]